MTTFNQRIAREILIVKIEIAVMATAAVVGAVCLAFLMS